MEGSRLMTGRIHSIESFGTVDGPGIRFVVFMQGCPMRCLYCHNPDTWDINGGRQTDAEEILAEYERCRAFLKNGGLTVTGGEPLLQKEFVTELFKKAKERGIHTCIDTSGVTFSRERAREFDELLSVCDLVMLDIKHISDEEHKRLTGHSNTNILDFARYICERGVEIWIRHVVVPGITDKRDEWYALGRFLAELPTLKAVDVLPYHDMGKVKYEALGMKYPLDGVAPLDKSVAAEAKSVILQGLSDELNNKG